MSKYSKIKNILIYITLPLLVLCLSSCATTQHGTKTIRIKPPANLLSPCPEPKLKSDSIGYLAFDYLPEIKKQLDKCNSKINTLREWSETEVK